MGIANKKGILFYIIRELSFIGTSGPKRASIDAETRHRPNLAASATQERSVGGSVQ
jgi:hypothetical protein